MDGAGMDGGCPRGRPPPLAGVQQAQPKSLLIRVIRAIRGCNCLLQAEPLRICFEITPASRRPATPPRQHPHPQELMDGFLTPASLKTQRRQDNRNLLSPSAPPRFCAKTSPPNHPTKNCSRAETQGRREDRPPSFRVFFASFGSSRATHPVPHPCRRLQVRRRPGGLTRWGWRCAAWGHASYSQDILSS